MSPSLPKGKGQRAWGRIKATAAEQRVLWLEIGNALVIGRQQNQSDKDFGKWIKAYGFWDMHRNTRANAMWLSANLDLLHRRVAVEIPKEFTHPTNIRDWAREQELESSLPSELQSLALKSTTVLNARDGERVAKTLLRANSNGEGSDIAKKQVSGLAKKHGTTEEGLKEA